MGLFSTLTEKSWLPQPDAIDSMASKPATDFSSKKVALWLFLAVVTVFFTLLVVTFLMHALFPGFQALAGEPWQPFTDTSRLWFNTSLLLLSSLAMHLSFLCAQAKKAGWSLAGLIVAFFFSLQFLLAQLFLWRHLTGMGYGYLANPSSSYFYLLTALHGLHLAAGILVLVKPLRGFWRNSPLTSIAGSIKLCSIYWHYLLGVWLAVFALLASSKETYQTLAALCGL